MRTLTTKDMAIMFILGIVLGLMLNQYMHESYSCNMVINGLEKKIEWHTENEFNVIIEDIIDENPEMINSFWDKYNKSSWGE